MTMKMKVSGLRAQRTHTPGVTGTIGFHFCPSWGCVAYWRASAPGEHHRRRIAVNLRLAEPEVVGSIVVDHFDGLDSWKDLPRDGRCIADMWF